MFRISFAVKPMGQGAFIMCIFPSVVIVLNSCCPDCVSPIEEVVELNPLLVKECVSHDARTRKFKCKLSNDPF